LCTYQARAAIVLYYFLRLRLPDPLFLLLFAGNLERKVHSRRGPTRLDPTANKDRVVAGAPNCASLVPTPGNGRWRNALPRLRRSEGECQAAAARVIGASLAKRPPSRAKGKGIRKQTIDIPRFQVWKTGDDRSDQAAWQRFRHRRGPQRKTPNISSWFVPSRSAVRRRATTGSQCQ
jgi:hypothetical protein